MTDTGGIDVLIAWAIFVGLLLVLSLLVLRHHSDPIDEANRRTDGTAARDDDDRRV